MLESGRFLEHPEELLHGRREHLVLLEDRGDGPVIRTILNLHGGQRLLGDFLDDRALRHNGNAGVNFHRAFHRLDVVEFHRVSGSTPCSFKILSKALRVGMSGSKPMIFCPASCLNLMDFCLANGCCGWQINTSASLRSATISSLASLAGYATNPMSTTLLNTSS